MERRKMEEVNQKMLGRCEVPGERINGPMGTGLEVGRESPGRNVKVENAKILGQQLGQQLDVTINHYI